MILHPIDMTGNNTCYIRLDIYIGEFLTNQMTARLKLDHFIIQTQPNTLKMTRWKSALRYHEALGRSRSQILHVGYPSFNQFLHLPPPITPRIPDLHIRFPSPEFRRPLLLLALLRSLFSLPSFPLSNARSRSPRAYMFRSKYAELRTRGGWSTLRYDLLIL